MLRVHGVDRVAAHDHPRAAHAGAGDTAARSAQVAGHGYVGGPAGASHNPRTAAGDAGGTSCGGDGHDDGSTCVVDCIPSRATLWCVPHAACLTNHAAWGSPLHHSVADDAPAAQARSWPVLFLVTSLVPSSSAPNVRVVVGTCP